MEGLNDPLNDRFMKDIVPPPHKPLSEEILYINKCILILKFTIETNAPNWESLKSHLYKEGRVSKEHC
jgi:serine/threonine-protein phosphatase 2B catalytic subunit